MMLPEMTSSARMARAFQRLARGAVVGLALGGLAACGGGGSSKPATPAQPETPAEQPEAPAEEQPETPAEQPEEEQPEAPGPTMPEIPITQAREVGEKFQDCPECPEMVGVPAGSFLMGLPERMFERAVFGSNAMPQHRVTIARPFAVGVYEVTFEEWDACVAAGGCNRFDQPYDEGYGRGRRPVINALQRHAKAYVAWLSGKTGGSTDC